MIRVLVPSEANKLIPPILKLLQLKRTSATRIDNVPSKGSYRIGAEIPPGQMADHRNDNASARAPQIRKNPLILLWKSGLGI